VMDFEYFPIGRRAPAVPSIEAAHADERLAA
jgi:hypothetical protein